MEGLYKCDRAKGGGNCRGGKPVWQADFKDGGVAVEPFGRPSAPFPSKPDKNKS
jgi:hypothetical protein